MHFVFIRKKGIARKRIPGDVTSKIEALLVEVSLSLPMSAFKLSLISTIWIHLGDVWLARGLHSGYDRLRWQGLGLGSKMH